MTQAANWTDFDAVRPLAARDFEQIRELAYRTFGLDLKAGKEELVAARLRRLVQGCGFRSYQEYYRHVLEDRTGEALAAMIDALATNHTSFLREPDHFAFLRDHVIPPLASRERVEIWSAACATGEEVWTLAFVLNELVAARKIGLFGTDISNKALARAQRAIYDIGPGAGLPGAWLTRYFVRESKPQSYRVSGEIRAQAKFRRLNLIEPFTWPHPYPVIFCRNVMIYFNRATQAKVVNRLSASLEPGGYLFVGHAESLTGIEHQLEYVRPAVYRKPAGRKEARCRS